MAGLIGMATTLTALNGFTVICMTDLQPKVEFITLHKEYGPAFLCLAVATILKAVDVGVHLLVPVPDEGYWSPNKSEPVPRVTSYELKKLERMKTAAAKLGSTTVSTPNNV